MKSKQTFFSVLLHLVSAGLFVGVLAACSTAAAPPATAAPITVGMANFSLSPSATSAKAGEVTFIAVNNATDLQHELIVIKSDLPADKLTVGSDNKVDEEAVTSIGEVSETDAGKSGTVTLKLEAGHYVLICNIAGHYSQGMHVDFTVNP